jgi:4-amino-4-deoxychorismate lyase
MSQACAAHMVNGIADGVVSPQDRGLAYGDGVFRSVKLRDGAPLWWDDHYRILARDCAAIGIACPDADLLRAEIAALAAQLALGVARIAVTRGVAERGYRPPAQATPTRIVAVSATPAETRHVVVARWCELRLARQPRLAGVKHLNRLENVLARDEWRDPAIAEGLLCDDTGALIGGTQSSVFAMRQGRLVVPDLSQCGIDGATRARVLRAAREQAIEVQIERIAPAALAYADELFVGNSVAGLWRVGRLGDLSWPDAGWTAQFRSWIDV